MKDSLKLAYVVAQNVDALRDFYASALGLPVRFQDGAKWCQLDGGGIDLAISSVEEAAPCPRGTFAVFRTDDMSAARDRVAVAGGKVSHQRDMGAHGSVVTCTDVEGNHFQIFASAPITPIQEVTSP